MPELPEVETVRRGLQRLVVGLPVRSVTALEPGGLRGDPSPLIGRRIAKTWRRGKVLGLDFEDGWSLVAHLKMTGQLVYRAGPAADAAGSAPDAAGPAAGDAGPAADAADAADAAASAAGDAAGDAVGDIAWGGGHPSDSLIGPLPDKSTRVIIEFGRGRRLYFNDQRKFGWLAAMPTIAAGAIPLLAKMGPEPFGPEAWPEFRRRARRHRRAPIKAVLLDQSVIAGIGNIYADEALWAARVHPQTTVAAISDRKLKQILSAAAAVMELSLDLGGSTDRNYVDAEGRRGAYLDFAKVFRRQGQPCPRCGRPIIKTRVAGRGTHLCPRCQRRQTPPAA
ncbi:MAG: bifunctional DNA-formamidopyrimidine glycosylase/DNA-(apurinic or apyrimidinic site) lyase [Bifidobacteriaceae bacterium]|nr:bifunctional DNA-formamidopyrimidine glycosylase/DNA-(apurinic or apyrimidinic site) lyase [Bifidobacteriaceae bacterium]